jgi:hypothetical protein
MDKFVDRLFSNYDAATYTGNLQAREARNPSVNDL